MRDVRRSPDRVPGAGRVVEPAGVGFVDSDAPERFGRWWDGHLDAIRGTGGSIQSRTVGVDIGVVGAVLLDDVGSQTHEVHDGAGEKIVAVGAFVQHLRPAGADRSAEEWTRLRQQLHRVAKPGLGSPPDRRVRAHRTAPMRADAQSAELPDVGGVADRHAVDPQGRVEGGEESLCGDLHLFLRHDRPWAAGVTWPVKRDGILQPMDLGQIIGVEHLDPHQYPHQRGGDPKEREPRGNGPVPAGRGHQESAESRMRARADVAGIAVGVEEVEGVIATAEVGEFDAYGAVGEIEPGIGVQGVHVGNPKGLVPGTGDCPAVCEFA
ncbi:Uncharacterised protein [Mycobacteroides abscessus subsp. abscessus]|nr:Uncharacterised protein [Mycobacteroides abscessus subsp. abscessus]